MLELVVPHEIQRQLLGDLRKAGKREIGGLLLGEHIASDRFKVVEITVQHTGGGVATFRRDPTLHRAAIEAFFKRTGCDYQRFNYLGEWHSHPSFATRPSLCDAQEMGALLADPNLGTSFAVLLIARQTMFGGLDANAYVFQLGQEPRHVRVMREYKTHWI
jgi:proteasome lid subunit RPN8/RPN11